MLPPRFTSHSFYLSVIRDNLKKTTCTAWCKQAFGASYTTLQNYLSYLFTYREITNIEDLMSKLDLKDFNNLIVLMQKTVEGVISNFKMDKLQTTGATCKLANLLGSLKVRLISKVVHLPHTSAGVTP